MARLTLNEPTERLVRDAIRLFVKLRNELAPQTPEAQIAAAAQAIGAALYSRFPWRDLPPATQLDLISAARAAAPHLRPQGAPQGEITMPNKCDHKWVVVPPDPPAAQPVGDGELVERALEIFERHFNWRGMPGLARSGMADVVKSICAAQREKDAKEMLRDFTNEEFQKEAHKDDWGVWCVYHSAANRLLANRRARLLAEPKATVALPPLRICGDYYEAIVAQLKEREEQLLGALTKIAELQAQAGKGEK